MSSNHGGGLDCGSACGTRRPSGYPPIVGEWPVRGPPTHINQMCFICGTNFKLTTDQLKIICLRDSSPLTGDCKGAKFVNDPLVLFGTLLTLSAPQGAPERISFLKFYVVSSPVPPSTAHSVPCIATFWYFLAFFLLYQHHKVL